MEEEGENYPTAHRKLTQQRVLVCLPPGKEAFHLVTSEWWNEEVKLRIQAWRQVDASQERHYISMNPLKSMTENHQAMKGYLRIDSQSPLPNQEIPSMDLLIWNCRGAGNKKFKRTMRELVQIHKPELVVLMEPKVEFKDMGMFFNCMGFTASAHVNPIGRSGGIWMIWNPNVVNVRVVEACSQQITATISRQDFQDWVLSAVYASPNANKRDELWEQLQVLAQTIEKPWLVAGDFNDFTSQHEKRSFQGNNSLSLSQDQRRNRKFNNRLNNCKLMDLGCAGPRLTWSNNRKGWANTMVRLDKAMCNTEWCTVFPDGAVKPKTTRLHFLIWVGKVAHSKIGRRWRLDNSWNTIMFKQSPSRNHRSKGIKVNRVFQICALLAVCFWLVYQVKHSHDKKKEFDENDAKISHEKHFDGEISKIGRKAILPGLEETTMKNDEVEEEETGGGEEEEEVNKQHEEEEQKEENKTEEKEEEEQVNKQHEEEEQKEENKTEEKEDEGGGGGDDQIDERDLEKSEMGVEHEVDFINEEKEREEADEKEAENKGFQNENENENSLEDRNHDGGNRNAHKAREEHYKADDASSAVTHETEGGSMEDSNKKTEMNSRGEENKVNNAEEIAVAQNRTGVEDVKGEMVENVASPNVTGKKEKGYEIGSSKLEDSWLLNSTMTTKANNQPEMGNNNSTDGSSETNNLSLQNETETKASASKAQNATVEGTTSEDSALQTIALGQENNSNATASNNNQSDSNLTISSNTENLEAAAEGEFSNSSSTSELSVSEKVATSNASVGVEGTSTTEEHTDATRNEKSETSDGTDVKDESRDSAKTENPDVVHHDPIDSSIPLEKDVRTDLDTLPEIRTEGSNNEDAAAE
ncbi:hypothetical protein LOK49_LG02G03284 [Camellia lanceoleosa]|uniref:Uncharacterized protein n=1 Tax=Camellia lanceoleosa TaxID=1840588 RepID=A0ACC0INX6_9ERIC|nr:hypothetical protein LOK49_LG02G03284 [Camellia lanceoleosa]